MNKKSSSEHFKRVKSLLHDEEAVRRLHAQWDEQQASNQAGGPPGGDDHEQTVTEWLGHLRLLHGVPFHYLVPDPRMLPPESIRFFTVDPNWVDYLADGACSNGRNTKAQKIHENVCAQPLLNAALRVSHNLRRSRLGLEPSNEVNETSTAITGFLLRSSVLANWPGLEVSAFDAGGNPLATLRMEQLGSSVLAAFFAGLFHKIEFRKSGEILHFGFDDENLEKDLRTDLDKLHARSNQAAKQVKAEFRDGVHRVINIKDLAGQMETQLKGRGEMLQAAQFTSAEFAQQMVARLERVSYERK